MYEALCALSCYLFGFGCTVTCVRPDPAGVQPPALAPIPQRDDDPAPGLEGMEPSDELPAASPEAYLGPAPEMLDPIVHLYNVVVPLPSAIHPGRRLRIETSDLPVDGMDCPWPLSPRRTRPAIVAPMRTLSEPLGAINEGTSE